jgi:hypothetical protein
MATDRARFENVSAFGIMNPMWARATVQPAQPLVTGLKPPARDDPPRRPERAAARR